VIEDKIKSVESLKDISKRFSEPINPNVAHRKGLSQMEKLAVFATERIGTMGFFFIILSWTLGWLFWNMFAPRELRFDPYPAFVLWLFISNLIQIHLMPLIMVGQNIQGRHAQIRTEHSFQTEKKAEKEIETIISHLENQNRILSELLNKIRDLEQNHKKS